MFGGREIGRINYVSVLSFPFLFLKCVESAKGMWNPRSFMSLRLELCFYEVKHERW